ncbi:hypothetical protein WJX72_009098 [[Myrmecia] bisecta]|uniref:Uncharacterized protein n=1 Tax=[Myrmecia] bisecta TaxID=41462 RepID=A0AAW1P860_9CHLO
MSAPGQCRLLAGPAAISAQLVLAAVAIGALAYKRVKERPQRPWLVWTMDISKQILSAAAAHICGMLIAILVAEGGASHASECAWYFVAFSFDTTLGVSVAVGIHKLAVRQAREWTAIKGLSTDAREPWYSTIAECGNYGDPPSWRRFLIQLVEWCLAVILGRVVCGTVVVLAKGGLVGVAQVLDMIFSGHPALLLFFVMVACPLGMNLVQMLVQDWILKFKQAHHSNGDIEVKAAEDPGVRLLDSPQRAVAPASPVR